MNVPAGNVPSFLQDCLVDLSDKIPEPFALFAVGGCLVASPGNIEVIKGSQKSGKTFTLSAFVAAWVNQTCLEVVSHRLPGKNKIWVLDTEQSKAHVFKVLKRIHRLADYGGASTNHPDIRILYTKDRTQAEKIELLCYVCGLPDTGVVFVDGIVDLFSDFNDLTEASKARDMLLQLASQNEISIFGIIHVNKSDNNSRGHLGAILEQKAETVFQVRKTPEQTFEVSCAYSRNIPFEPFMFGIDSEGIPYTIRPEDPETIRQRKAETLQATKRNHIRAAIESGFNTYTKLVQQYMKLSGYSEGTAKRDVGNALSDRFIIQNSENETYTVQK